ncbi:MAG: hypothetical protein IT350_00570 [Deltaproteobacteria bacterium]|nr:hypothetical protein [Deltaproteobacteria bacterium]
MRPFAPVVIAVLTASILLVPAGSRPANAGEGDEVLVGFLIGTSAGLVAGGAITILWRNPDADRNITTILVSSSLIGATAGTLWGLSLPDDAFEKDPVVSVTTDGQVRWSLSFPTIGLATIAEHRADRIGGHVELLGARF